MKKMQSTRKGKEARHAAILQLIASEPIERQEVLQQRLLEKGFEATQATISRDIRQLNLVKSMGPQGRYCYTAPQAPETAESYHTGSRFETIFRESTVGVDYAGHIVLVRCYNGMANAACEVFDKLKWQNVVGTLAGDDTFFILARTENDAADICVRLKEFVKRG